MKKKGEDRRYANDALIRLTNRISLNAMSDELVLSNVATFLGYCDESKVQQAVERLAATERIASLLNFEIRNLAQFSDLRAFNLDKDRLYGFFEGSFRARAGRLRTMLQAIVRFESSFLNGDFDDALAELDSMQSVYGYSLWIIRHRMLTLAAVGRLEEMQQYCDSCKSDCGDKFSAFLINCFLLVSSNPLLHTRKVISGYVRELDAAGYPAAADFLRLLFVSSDLAPTETLLDVSLVQGYPLIDQLFLLRKALASNVSLRRYHGRQQRTREVKLLGFISSLTAGAVGRQVADDSTGQIVKLYEKGEYEKVRLQFDNVLKYGVAGRVAILGLVAKSLAALEDQDYFPRGPIGELMSSLRSLYVMDVAPTRSREVVEALAVQAAQMISGPGIIALLYQVLPNQYSEKDRAVMAGAVVEMDASSSRWLHSLSLPRDPLEVHEYLVADKDLPEYRLKKVDIRSALNRRESLSNVIGLLKEYKKAVPLQRDYNEVVSSTLLKLHGIDHLVAACAESLTLNSNSYTSFPLRQIVEHVENQGSSGIDSVIVIHFYVKNVDRSKEYLLNETYEEYLLDREIRKPSELLNYDEVVNDPRLLILLRDISTIEAMDFLGVFSGSNDVRAERVNILDFLFDGNLISAVRHRAEVDEILTQVVVDSGAAEISTQKIDVNDSVLGGLS